MNLSDLSHLRRAVAADRALRISGGSPSCSYTKLSTAAVTQLKSKAHNHTAKEWAVKLNSSANTIRHRCKALGVTLKPFVR